MQGETLEGHRQQQQQAAQALDFLGNKAVLCGIGLGCRSFSKAVKTRSFQTHIHKAVQTGSFHIHMTREGHQDQFGLQCYGFVLEQVWKAFSPEKGQSFHLPDHMTFKEILAGIFGGCTRSFDGKKPVVCLMWRVLKSKLQLFRVYNFISKASMYWITWTSLKNFGGHFGGSTRSVDGKNWNALGSKKASYRSIRFTHNSY